MKKLVVLFLGILMVVSLAGCGGGGSTPGVLTVYFHFQDSSNNNAPIVGVKLGYTDPSGTQATSSATGDNGEFSVVLTKAGTYIINTVYYNGQTYNLADYDATFTVNVEQGDIDGNKRIKETIPIDMSTNPPSIGEPIEVTL